MSPFCIRLFLLYLPKNFQPKIHNSPCVTYNINKRVDKTNMSSYPVTVQPSKNDFIDLPLAGQQTINQPLPPTIVPGLEYLAQIDQLLIKQKIELVEVFTDCETRNKYEIKNTLGQPIYKAKESSNCCMRQCCGPNRHFKMKIKDNNGREVLICDRPFKCNCGPCFPCCMHKMKVYSPITGETLGYVRQDWSCTRAKLSIYDADDKKVFNVDGTCCGFNCCSDVNFHVSSVATGQAIGNLQKQWSGCCKEAFTDADNFSVSFPLDLKVELKAVLVGAMFLLDFLYFEKQPDKNQNNYQ